MHRLILMRHAEADGRAPEGGGDKDRPLTPKGLQDAARMGKALAERGFRPDLALVSAAVRTQQTWEQVQDAIGDVEVQVLDHLYDAPARTLRDEVEINEDNEGCVMVLAHNPGIHQLAVDYLIESAASPAVLDRFAGGFPTGGCAVFTVDAAGRPSYEGWLTPASV
ncbi:histidine phosphatase family protein [uncultured Brevundimonas sp.]|uniref:SixA phosphatase family protein n=1 Tax=uncultured Brevundimonas sp. TaxID=213418 RepID=UPI00262989F4|nr:histidine phosphatase family protein [uncultured Brevundimonas sp.]